MRLLSIARNRLETINTVPNDLSQDGFLAEPKTAEQFEFVSSLAFVEESLTGVAAWWVGLADFGHEGEWVWQVSHLCLYL